MALPRGPGGLPVLPGMYWNGSSYVSGSAPQTAAPDPPTPVTSNAATPWAIPGAQGAAPSPTYFPQPSSPTPNAVLPPPPPSVTKVDPNIANHAALQGLQSATSGASSGGAGGSTTPTDPTTTAVTDPQVPTPVTGAGDASAGLNLDALRAQPNGYLGGGPGALRPYLGTRTPPQDMALTALQRKAY